MSVIVINYNYGRFLDECLMSIAHQTYPHIECIVFDNASTDNSHSVLASAESKHFAEDGRSLSVIFSQTNLYQTPAAAEAFKNMPRAVTSFSSTRTIICCRPAWKHISARCSLCAFLSAPPASIIS
ncbi:MAG: glycosyltransferase [Methylovirgula sp.]